jgi:hypothetical protein
MAVYFRSTAAERMSTPAHLRVVLQREEGALQVRIPKRRGPPLSTPVPLPVGRHLRRSPAADRPVTPSPILLPERARAFQLAGR